MSGDGLAKKILSSALMNMMSPGRGESTGPCHYPQLTVKGAKTLVCLGTWASQGCLRGSRDGLIVRLPGLRVAAEVAASQRPTRGREGHRVAPAAPPAGRSGSAGRASEPTTK